MSLGDQITSATHCNLVGALLSNALLNGTRPKRALVFLAMGSALAGRSVLTANRNLSVARNLSVR